MRVRLWKYGGAELETSRGWSLGDSECGTSKNQVDESAQVSGVASG